MQLRWPLAVAFLALGANPGPVLSEDSPTEVVHITVEQSRDLAFQLLEAGDTARATVVADALLERDPKDTAALQVKAWAAILAGTPEKASAPARQLFLVSAGDPALRQEATKLLAKAAYDRQKYSWSILWLRLGSDYVQTPAEMEEIAQSIAGIRAQNPWRVNLSFNATPSSNVNGGSSEGAQDAEWFGIPIELRFDDSAKAIPGIEFSAQLDVAYRVHQSEKAQSYLGFRTMGNTYALTQDSYREIVPDAGAPYLEKVKGNEFAYGAVEVYVNHSILPASGNGVYSMSARLGQSWYAGNPYTRFGQIDLSRYLKLGEDRGLNLSVSLQRSEEIHSPRTNWSPTLRADLTTKLASGDTLSSGVALSQKFSNDVTSEYRQVEMSLGYDLDKPVGPFEVSLSVSGHYEMYDLANLGGTRFGERQDYGVDGMISLGMPQAQVMGFTPSFNISAGKTWSDVSRYKTVDLGVGFGWESRF